MILCKIFNNFILTQFFNTIKCYESSFRTLLHTFQFMQFLRIENPARFKKVLEFLKKVKLFKRDLVQL